MLHEEIPCLLIGPGKTMTVIKFIVFIRACRAIEPLLFIAFFIIMFLTAVSYFHPATVRIIFPHRMGRVRIIRIYEKWFWKIRRGGLSTIRTFRGNRDGIWDQICGTTGFLMQMGSINNGNER